LSALCLGSCNIERFVPARWTIRHVSRRIHASARAKPIKHIPFARKMSLKASTMLHEQDGCFACATSASPTHRRDASYAPQSLTQVPHAQGTTVTRHSQLLSAWASDIAHSKNRSRCAHRSA
jgi:hypothetical protein